MKKTYTFSYTPTFKKGIKHLERSTQIELLNKLTVLKTNPYAGKPLRGDWKGVYSLRTGRYRILYSIEKTNINLLYVGHRKHIYQ